MLLASQTYDSDQGAVSLYHEFLETLYGDPTTPGFWARVALGELSPALLGVGYTLEQVLQLKSLGVLISAAPNVLRAAGTSIAEGGAILSPTP